MTTRLKAILGIGVVGLLAVIGVLWFLGVFSSEPPPVSLSAACEILAEEDVFTDVGFSDLDGTWTVQPHEGTYVGYRVKEVLSTIGEFEAVGRTPLVNGSLEAEGLTVNALTIDADLTGLASDSSARDGQVGRQGLETETFPTGAFVLSSPITIDEIPTDCSGFTTVAAGELTLHGVTNTVAVDIEATALGDQFIVIGRMDILMSDYGIEAPSAPIVASIEDQAEMELSLIFARN